MSAMARLIEPDPTGRLACSRPFSFHEPVLRSFLLFVVPATRRHAGPAVFPTCVVSICHSGRVILKKLIWITKNTGCAAILNASLISLKA
jgi:hypothetical protein